MSATNAAALKPILIAGPTASGKSQLALRMAEQHGGVVINADSMQVYRELRVLTARPSDEDTARAPHWLYGHVAATDAYSTGRFLKDAEAALQRAAVEGLRPIIVGGTGLYFKALLEGLAPVPDIHPDIRAHWRGEAAHHGAYWLWQILTERDPVMAFQLDVNDTQRIVRALEVLDATGISLAEWKQRPTTPLLREADTERFLVSVDRSVLVRRAEARFTAMIAGGALEEIARLETLQLDANLPAMRAIGVKHLLAVRRGEQAIDAAIAASIQDTKAYIKRQQTWSARYMSSWNGIKTE